MKTSLASLVTICWLVVSSLMYLMIVLLSLPIVGALIFDSPGFIMEPLFYFFAVNKYHALLTPVLLIFFALRIEKFQNRTTIAALMTLNWALWAYSFRIVSLS